MLHPCHTLPHPATPCHAQPRPAMPCHTCQPTAHRSHMHVVACQPVTASFPHECNQSLMMTKKLCMSI